MKTSLNALQNSERSASRNPPTRIGQNLVVAVSERAVSPTSEPARHGHPTVVWLVAALLCRALQCAGGTLPDSVAPPPKEVLDQLGRIGVAASGSVPDLSAPIPITRRAAAKQWARQCAWPEDGISVDPRTAVIQLAWAPVGALLGASAGTLSGVSEKKVKGSVAVLAEVRSEFQDTHRLVAHLIDTAKEKSGAQWALVPLQSGESDKPRLVRTSVTGNSSRALAAADQTAVTAVGIFASTEREEVDTWLEVTVLSQRLVGRQAVNPRLSLEVALRVRLIRTSDDAELYSMYPRYDGGCQKLTEWAANHGQSLRTELDHAYRELSERIAEKISSGAGQESLAMK